MCSSQKKKRKCWPWQLFYCWTDCKWSQMLNYNLCCLLLFIMSFCFCFGTILYTVCFALRCLFALGHEKLEVCLEAGRPQPKRYLRAPVSICLSPLARFGRSTTMLHPPWQILIFPWLKNEPGVWFKIMLCRLPPPRLLLLLEFSAV